MQLSCMRAITNYTKILEAIPASTGTQSILGFFVPTVDNKVVFANYSQIQPAKVPMLIGNNNYEAGLFRTEFALSGVTFSDAFWTDFDLQEFTCPAGVRANASVSANIPIWRYRYMGVFPDTAISSEAGTWHGSEIPIIFDTVIPSPGPTQAEISIANYMRGGWAAFAKDPEKGLLNYGWPLYNTSQDTLVRLAYDNVTGPNLINPYRYDADCVFVNIHSTNSSSSPQLPNLGSSVTPTGTSSATATGASKTNGTSTGTAATTLATGGAVGMHMGVGAWVGFAALFAAYLV